MALANYTDLLAAINGWLGRGTDMNTIAPDLIALAEAEFNRRLRTIDMEASTTIVLTSGVGALPSDFAGFRSVSLANTRLDQVELQTILDIPVTFTGTPYIFAVADGNVIARPVSSDTLSIYYYQRIPALTSGAPTNWLMTANPDLYLFGSLMQAEFYNWNDDRLPLVKARTDELIDQLNGDVARKRYGSRTLRARSLVSSSSGRIAA